MGWEEEKITLIAKEKVKTSSISTTIRQKEEAAIREVGEICKIIKPIIQESESTPGSSTQF